MTCVLHQPDIEIHFIKVAITNWSYGLFCLRDFLKIPPRELKVLIGFLQNICFKNEKAIMLIVQGVRFKGQFVFPMLNCTLAVWLSSLKDNNHNVHLIKGENG